MCVEDSDVAASIDIDSNRGTTGTREFWSLEFVFDKSSDYERDSQHSLAPTRTVIEL